MEGASRCRPAPCRLGPHPAAPSLPPSPSPHPAGALASGLFSYLFEVLWAFSEYLEAIAIMPQLIMTQRHGGVENITSWYIATLGAYRGLYICNWVFR